MLSQKTVGGITWESFKDTLGIQNEVLRFHVDFILTTLVCLQKRNG